jgi:xanthine dehydrogenase accessory factor
MKELAEILKACAARPGEVMALATVVQTTGSGYRRPGARMLILTDGDTVGSISGGCLERNVILRAEAVRKTGKSVLLTYDTASEEDIVFGTGFSCNGVVCVLLEQVKAAFPGRPVDGLLDFLGDSFTSHRSGVVATVIRTEGGMAGVGDRVMVDSQGNAFVNLRDAGVRDKLLAEARSLFATNRSAINKYELATGFIEVFFEVLQPPARLVILGAGYDAPPLVRLGKEVGFHVAVVDGRPAYATAERFPGADAVMVADPENLPKKIPLNDQTCAVIMSHNYPADRGWLAALLPVPLRYLGVMGPRKRVVKMLEELSKEGFQPAGSQLARLHNPVGLDIGAESPEQIALSILAEIQAVMTNHAGGLLCEKKGPIHLVRNAEEAASPRAAQFKNEETVCVV